MKPQENSSPEKCKVLIVDDHPIVRYGLIQLINQQTDLIVCGEAEDAPKALELVEQLKPNIALVDISLKLSNGLELVKDIHLRYPELPLLVVSMHDELLYAERVLKAGAIGYLMKQGLTDNVIQAIRQVLSGEIYVSERMAARMLHKFAGRSSATGPTLESLSDRELQVFQLIGQGREKHQIAEELHLSVKTIETYREHIKRKLKLKNATELIQHAVQWTQGSQAIPISST